MSHCNAASGYTSKCDGAEELGSRLGLSGVGAATMGARGVPDVNTGKEWSELDLQDLRDGVRLRFPLRELAEFLMRDLKEVKAKAAEPQAKQRQSS